MVIRVEQFDYDLIENYFLSNLSENNFWLFASHAFETEQPVSPNTNFTSRELLEKTIFGIELSSTDKSFMIPFQPWEENKTYVQYDDTIELKGTSYYVVVEPETESGNYHIFKCLSNNGGEVSTQKPLFNPAIIDGIYVLGDGYIWKYMTSTPFSLFQKFATSTLIPIPRNQQVEDVAEEGIYNIVVENPLDNFGYERITGLVSSFEQISGGSITRIFPKNLFSQTLNQIPIFDIPNTYANRSVYIEKSNSGIGIGAINVKIETSGLFGGLPFITIQTPIGFNIEADDSIEILPRIEIQGTGTGASAVVIFDEQNQRISSVKLLNFGTNYSKAVASVIATGSFDPANPNRQDVECILRPIIAPSGGHGFNILSELKARNIGLSKNITSSGISNIPDVGSYSKISLIKNPVFDVSFSDNTFDNRIKIDLNFIPGNMIVGDIVSQGLVQGRVHEIDTGTNSIFVAEYDGPYSEVFVSNLPLTHRGINYVINNIDYSLYESGSGDVLTISDVDPIERTAGGSERIKIILDF